MILVDGNKELGIFARVAEARSDSKYKPNLAGVMIQPNGPDQTLYIATDGFMLAIGLIHRSIEGLDDRGIIVPASMVKAMCAKGIKWGRLEGNGDPLTLEFSSNKGTILDRPVEGQYPEVRKVVAHASSNLEPGGLTIPKVNMGLLNRASAALYGSTMAEAQNLAPDFAMSGGMRVAQNDGVTVFLQEATFRDHDPEGSILAIRENVAHILTNRDQKQAQSA